MGFRHGSRTHCHPFVFEVAQLKEVRAVFGHSMVYAFAAILNRGAGFLLLPVYTRALEPSDYGILGVITVTSEVVGALIGVRLGAAMSRLYFDSRSDDDRSELVSTAILGIGAIVLTTCLVFGLFAGPLARVALNDGSQGPLLFIGVVGLLLNILFTIGLQYYVILQRSRLVLAISTMRSIVYLGFGVLFVPVLQMGVLGALVGIFSTNACLVLLITLPLLWRIGIRFSPTKFKALVKFGAPLVPGQLAELLVKFTDRYLLVDLASLAAAGLFFLGLRLSAILQMAIISPFNQIYIVRRFEAHGAGEDDHDAPRVFTYFFAVIVSGALGLSLLAPNLVALLAFRRPDYLGAASVIPLLCLAEVLRSITLMKELGIFYAKRTRSLTLAAILTLVIHVPATALSIATFGLLGAAFAAVLSTTFRLGLTSYLARGLGGPSPQWRSLATLLGCGIATFLIVSSIGSFENLIADGAVRFAVALLFPLLILMGPLFTSEERAEIKLLVTGKLLKKRRPAHEDRAS
jgi:O-antigen/teichoic acid export membrane protein